MARMTAASVGIVLFRWRDGALHVLLGHPGGPFWRHRDIGAWTIPKGAALAGESPEDAARREFAEETGLHVTGPLQFLGGVRQRGGKQVDAFAFEGDFDVTQLCSNVFEMEWPPRSGRQQAFPELDRVQWFDLPEARERILPAQRPFLDRLEALCGKR